MFPADLALQIIHQRRQVFFPAVQMRKRILIKYSGDKSEPTCKPKAKRGSKIRAAPKPIPTENIYNTDTTPFKILIKASKISSKEWTVSRNGEGHAMQLSVRPSFFSVPHAIYIAGYFVIGYNDDEVTNKCGEVVHVERTWKREYIAGEYDLLFDTHPDRNPTGACSLGDHAGALTWVTDLEDAFPHYKYLGRIKPGLSNSDIIAQSETVLANMGKYIMVKNNCFTFVKKTYADEAA
ncbi:Glycoside hydrolase superfamily [Penicillium hordei]|uniref:Glycoside hydrolase superfamily n=1 Tax=Penicillium hordei TaxID=40994 RepID=A0AAD6E075_9EURO|nr:Glycoside hydrolase superfamily [Penicillium hordei]KAJ5598075.1 Glycoside hydrolase superfamily [Penicillium hordei]